MSLTRSICVAPTAIIVLVVCACTAVSTWGAAAYVVPALGSFAESMAAKYDTLFPEISISNGQASIREPQPYVVEDLDDKELLVMVDTREDKISEILERLKKVPVAVVLTKDDLVVKNHDEIRFVPLKNMPDMVVNSTEIQALLRDYLPMVTGWIIIGIAIYFLFAKPLQILLVALIPYLAARSYAVELSYGEALKLASVALIGPVAMDFLLNMAGTHLPAQFALYFALYIALLVLAVRDLVKGTDSLQGEPPGRQEW